MSRFFSSNYSTLVPYTPGEQPKNRKYVKLNTNESPFPPSPVAQAAAAEAAQDLQLYPDPECTLLVEKAIQTWDVAADELLFTNGSDETLYFAFMAFCDEAHPAAFPDITYGFYPVYAKLCGIPYTEIPLREDFSVCVADYIGRNETIFIANPNAPTGLALSLEDIEAIVKSNPNNVVVIDEAYVDFGTQSAVPLIHKYDNLLVIQTFSKSRSMAGARLGIGFGSRDLIRDLNTLKYSTNPYNINRLTMAAGIGALTDSAYFESNCKYIIETRHETAQQLKKIGFTVTDSKANFLFAAHPKLPGKELYLQLKEMGIEIIDTPQGAKWRKV